MTAELSQPAPLNSEAEYEVPCSGVLMFSDCVFCGQPAHEGPCPTEEGRRNCLEITQRIMNGVNAKLS